MLLFQELEKNRKRRCGTRCVVVTGKTCRTNVTLLLWSCLCFSMSLCVCLSVCGHLVIETDSHYQVWLCVCLLTTCSWQVTTCVGKLPATRSANSAFHPVCRSVCVAMCTCVHLCSVSDGDRQQLPGDWSCNVRSDSECRSCQLVVQVSSGHQQGQTPINDGTRGGTVFIAVCLFFRTISQKPMQLGSPNLTRNVPRWVLEVHSFCVKRSKVTGHKKLPAWVF